ncbi:MAG: hypothetical protein QOJ63_3151 [Solirubrobacteraceae bacterium]|nr:hypothetical protein [Solirubrobacteraceae bacterium]
MEAVAPVNHRPYAIVALLLDFRVRSVSERGGAGEHKG